MSDAKHTPDETIEQTMERIHAPDLAAERDRLRESVAEFAVVCRDVLPMIHHSHGELRKRVLGVIGKAESEPAHAP